jgi:hypothetical protein
MTERRTDEPGDVLVWNGTTYRIDDALLPADRSETGEDADDDEVVRDDGAEQPREAEDSAR